MQDWKTNRKKQKSRKKHRSLEYIDWARAEFTCSDLSCLDERLGDFEKFPLPWLGEAHSTSQLGNQANRARSPRLSSWAACRLIYVFPLSLVYHETNNYYEIIGFYKKLKSVIITYFSIWKKKKSIVVELYYSIKLTSQDAFYKFLFI